MTSAIRRHLKQPLIVDLAANEQSMAALGLKYGVSVQAISNFNRDYADEISQAKEAIQAGLRAETLGLWVADKKARLASYQKDVDRLEDELDSDGLDATDRRGAMKVKHGALRNVAEELGDLKVSVDVDGSVKYTVEGTNTEDLK